MLLSYGEGMELRHLRYFVTVAEELNLTRAAVRLRVAQPALSRQMHDLEAELQTPLLERGRVGVQLTRAGRAFYPKARAILAQAADAANEARTVAGVISGRLVIGFPNGSHLNYLAPVIAAFRKAHPKVEFDFWLGLPPEQLKALRDLKIDLGFVTLPTPLDGLEHQVVWRVPVAVALPQKHPLARQRALELVDLRGEDFVFFPREARPELYDEFQRQCGNAGFRPRIVKEVGGNPTNMLGLVSVGVGVSVLPHFETGEHLRGIVWRPLIQPKLSVEFALIWRRKNASALIKEFASLAGTKAKPPEPDEGHWV